MDPEDPDSDPDHSQNLIISSFYFFGHILKISSKSVHRFLSYLAHKQTNRQTGSPRRRHNLLGGGGDRVMRNGDRVMRKRKCGAGSHKIFLKIGRTTLQRYPVGQKFRRNPSI